MLSMRKLVSATLVMTATTVIIVAIIFRQNLIDQVKVWSYEPSAPVVSLADRSGMSSGGKFYFYATNPVIESATLFNSDCRQDESKNPVLGCYIAGDDRIYIYDIQNSDLDGIKEVTAAHEMLHAVYARLSVDEKKSINNLLLGKYEQIKTPELETRIKYYESHDANSAASELFAILPTEFSDIGSELDRYYSKYFSDRQKVVSLHQKYSSTFADLKLEIQNLTSLLKSKKQDLELKMESLNYDVGQFNNRVVNFSSRAATSGGFSSISEFESEKSQIVATQQALSSRQNDIKQLIDQYNSDVERLNQLGVRMDSLNKSIDSISGVK